MNIIKEGYTVTPIGQIRSCYPEKFGVPRQAGLVAAATARLEFFASYGRKEMVRGLEEFSHIWVIFLFHESIEEGWRPTVRPLRLGGQQRVGLYASRSPHRPNPLGMSVVRLEKILEDHGTVALQLSGIDLLDGTPVLDVKPYVPYVDKREDATEGFTAQTFAEITVTIPDTVLVFCRQYQTETGRDLLTLLSQTLKTDPRPASQRTVRRTYGMRFWDVNVRWVVEDEGFRVVGCDREEEIPLQ